MHGISWVTSCYNKFSSPFASITPLPLVISYYRMSTL